MLNNIRTTIAPKNTIIKFIFILLCLNSSTCFFIIKNALAADDTQDQLIAIDQIAIELEAKLNSVKDKIKRAKQPKEEINNNLYGISDDKLQEYVSLLEETEAVTLMHLTSLKKQASLHQLQNRIENILANPQNMAIPLLPPYSLSVLDEYLDKVETQNQKMQNEQLAVQVAKKNLDDAKLNYDKAEQKLRKMKNEGDSKAGEKDPGTYEVNLIVEELEFDLAGSILDLNKIHLQNAETEANLTQQQGSMLKGQLALIRANLKYDEEDLQEKLKVTKAIRQQHNERIKSLADEQQEVEKKWLEAQKLFDSIENKDENSKMIAKTWLEERQAWKNTYEQTLVQTENIFRLLSFVDVVWNRRYALLQGNYTPAQLDEWLKELESSKKNIDRLDSLVTSEQNNLRSQIRTLEVTLSEKEDTLPQESITHILSTKKATEKLFSNNVGYITKIESIKLLETRFTDEIHEKRKNIRITDLVKSVALAIDKKLDFELYVIDDQPITIKKIIFALLIFSVGLILASLSARFVANRILVRTQLDQSAKAAIQKVSFFLLAIMLVLYALHTVNIPLTILTFFGGAVAIGVGFGSQNLINNFLSGFILMIERPIKINDIIEVDNIIGTVQHIGTRCTRIQTQANLAILVPNSSFLEKNIINWTLSDDIVRCSVSVGVAYGSSTRDTVNALKGAAQEYDLILKNPEHIIIFKDFGENALVFEIFFWIRLGNGRMVKAQTESNVRFLIEKHLREAGIIIAFPQRDVHMDTSRPLDLRIINMDQDC